MVSTSDVVARADLLGEQPARVLGTAGDLGAVARRDEGELHGSSTPAAVGPRAGSRRTMAPSVGAHDRRGGRRRGPAPAAAPCGARRRPP